MANLKEILEQFSIEIYNNYAKKTEIEELKAQIEELKNSSSGANEAIFKVKLHGEISNGDWIWTSQVLNHKPVSDLVIGSEAEITFDSLETDMGEGPVTLSGKEVALGLEVVDEEETYPIHAVATPAPFSGYDNGRDYFTQGDPVFKLNSRTYMCLTDGQFTLYFSS